jgi:hypothetical protein
MRCVLVGLGLFIVGCSSSGPTTPTVSYDSVAGSYAVPVSSTSGTPLTATISFTIVQSSSALSGTEAVSGTLNGNIPISGQGSFTGTIGSGTNPSVTIVVTGSTCTNVHETFSGSDDTANHRMTVAGPFYILNTDCSIALTYNLTLVLTH